MKKIVVIGSCNTDMVIKSEKLPVPGETVLGGKFFLSPGGKGANQAVAISRLGGKVTFITKVGNDSFGKDSLKLYEKEGINIKYSFLDLLNPSGVALINVDSKGENSITVASGANATLSIEDIDSVKKVIESAYLLVMQLEIPVQTVEHAAKLAYESGVKIILNPAPAVLLPESIYKYLYIITPNNTEAETLSGIKVTDWKSAGKAAKIIRDKGVDIVVVTLGALGALVLNGDNIHEIPAMEVDAVDTTAAGDVFNGALCVALAEEKGIVEAVEFACKSSALSVVRMGAQTSIPYRKEVIG